MLVSISHCCSRRNLKEKKECGRFGFGVDQQMETKFVDNILKLTGATVSEFGVMPDNTPFLVHGFNANGRDSLFPAKDRNALGAIIRKMRDMGDKLASIHVITKDRMEVVKNAVVGEGILHASPLFSEQLTQEGLIITNLIKKSVEEALTDSRHKLWYLVLNGNRREIHATKPPVRMRVIGELYATKADIYKSLNALQGVRYVEMLDEQTFKEELVTEPVASLINEVFGPDFRYEDLSGETLNERIAEMHKRLDEEYAKAIAEHPLGSILSALMGGKGVLDDLGGDVFGADFDSRFPRRNQDKAPLSDFAKAFSAAFQNANGGEDPFDRTAFDRPLDEMPAFKRTEPAWASSLGR